MISDDLEAILLGTGQPAGPAAADVWRWATVTATSPLRVRLDGEASALPFTPSALAAATMFTVGQRVLVQFIGRRAIVHPSDVVTKAYADAQVKLLDASWAQASASLTVTNTVTPQVIAGASITLTNPLTVDANAYLTYAADVLATAVGYDTLVVEVFVDGSAVSGSPQLLFQAPAVNARATVAQTWRTTIPSGAHTYGLRARKAAAGGTVAVNTQHTTITGQVIRA
jgi:hypothetical protein